MITLEKIDRELINTDESFLKENLVGVAIQIDDKGVGRHSAILIGVNGEYSLFHFGGKDVEMNNPVPTGEWYFYKELEIIPPDYSLNFLAHCEVIKENEPNPSYGFLFDGSYYKNGSYYTNSGIRNYTTCVGFCIKVISGFIYTHDEYFSLEDWDTNSMTGIDGQYPDYFNKLFAKIKQHNPLLDISDFKNYYKRITPSEYTASAYIQDLPIRKKKVEEILSDVEEAIINKRKKAS